MGAVAMARGIELEAVERTSRDLNKAIALSETWPRGAVRYLVDYYYQKQEDRIRAANQNAEKALEECEIHEVRDVVAWLGRADAAVEKNIMRVLDAVTDKTQQGRWAKSICGIGPVIAAGLGAHLDPTRAAHCSSYWKVAGQYPGADRKRGEKVAWNPALKRLCFLMGESFVKVSGREDDVYGKLWRARKEYETAQNEAGAYAETAIETLGKKKFGADTEARKWYEQGKLPPARIHLRAKRWAVKIFLAHYWMVGKMETTGSWPAERPYVMDHLGHKHWIEVPKIAA